MTRCKIYQAIGIDALVLGSRTIGKLEANVGQSQRQKYGSSPTLWVAAQRSAALERRLRTLVCQRLCGESERATKMGEERVERARGRAHLLAELHGDVRRVGAEQRGRRHEGVGAEEAEGEGNESQHHRGEARAGEAERFGKGGGGGGGEEGGLSLIHI